MSKHYFSLATDLSWEEMEKNILEQVLRSHNYNRTYTAEALQIGIRTLQRKLHKYGMFSLGKDPKDLKEYDDATI